MMIRNDSIIAKASDTLWNANKLQGNAISSIIPKDKQLLKWINNSWTASNADTLRLYKAGTGMMIRNDSIIAKASDTLWNANKLQGYAIDAVQPTINQVLTWNGSKWKGQDFKTGWVVDSVKKDTSNLYAAVTGNVGIGIQQPTALFHVQTGAFSRKDNTLTVTRNGLVGIGTIASDTAYKLSVNGYIRAKKIVVESGWADYVFADTYPLMPLPEVEKFIKQYHHLPNIPNAGQIEKAGLDVGAMQVKTMEKIEELTLYMIRITKENEELKARLAKLETLLKK